MKTRTIRQSVTIPAAPSEVYDLFMNAKKHAAFTASKVTMSNKAGGNFEVFDGYCHGHNLELKPGKKKFRPEDGWPDDHFSICTFEFEKAPRGTKLKFTQSNIPEHKSESLKDGWKQFYWKPLKAYLAQ